jgi:hypothetical protein
MKTSFRIAAIYGLTLFAIGCSNGDGGGVEGGADGGGGTSSYYVTPQTVQALDSTTWITDGTSVFTGNLTVTITGICARGISTISATVNSVAVAETAICDGNGNFSWVKVFTGPTAATGDLKDIVFKGLATDASVLYTATSFKVTVDDQDPANPVLVPSGSLVGPYYVNDPGGITFTGTSTEYNITCSSDFGGAAGCGSFAYSSGNINVVDTLVVAVPEEYTFKAVDFAGNESTGVSYTLLYSPASSPALIAENNASVTYNMGLATIGSVGTNGSLIGGGAYFGSLDTMTNGSVQFGATGILSNR